ncbi:MAG: hypothetical protein K2M79_00205 [Muribaculaceae bacterium]|nr:hypothetical protein [Muribaculaceae bacterium]
MNLRHFIILLPAVMLLGLSCSRSRNTPVPPAPNTRYAAIYDSASVFAPHTLDDILDDSIVYSSNPYDLILEPEDIPDEGGVRLPARFVGAYSKNFADTNSMHLEAAYALGTGALTSDSAIWEIDRPLVRIASCPHYYVEPLKHSHPYLVPEAAELLHEIGRRFTDSLAARGGGAYRPRVTSILRTGDGVRRLRRVNRNASAESAHVHGTTFDISYSKFACDSITTVRTFADLKALLTEILDDLHKENRCYIKHERRQACFHITVRPRTDNNKAQPEAYN